MARKAPPARAATSASLPSGSGTFYAVSGGTSGSGGNYAATPLPLAGSWQVGEGSGVFSYDYPFAAPPALGGSAPGLSLSYSSAVADGMSVAENGQAGMAGLGWNLNPGFISRRFAPCSADGQTGKGDFCWKTIGGDLVEEMTISLNGRSETLIAVPGTDEFRLRHDPAWKVTRTSDEHEQNSDNNQEAFKVQTPDGATYWFGYGGGTASTLTVPVFGNHAGEPCYTATVSTAHCLQAWQWNLDRVVDRNGNVTVFTYARETNYYSRWATTTNHQSYDRGGYLTKVEYGFAKPSGTIAHQEISLSVAPRCAQRMGDPTAVCASIWDHPEDFPDVPADLICNSTDTCLNASPSFFSTRVYDQVVTKTRKGVTVAASPVVVDTYDFRHSLPDPDGPEGADAADLWLNYITRTGSDDDGTEDSLPATYFAGVVLQNRVDPTGEQRTLKKFRVDSVRNERGGRVNVLYGHNDGEACDAVYVEDRSRDASTRECFAQKYTPPGGTARWVWFHKFIVKRIELADDALGISSDASTPDSHLGRLRRFEYEYYGDPGWRWSGSRNVNDADESWTDWRGYGRAVIHTKRVGPNQVPQTDDVAKRSVIVYRGLHDARENIAGDLASVKLDTDEHETTANEPNDVDWLTGQVAEEKVFLSAGDTEPTRTYHEYVGWTSAASPVGVDAVVSAERRTSTYTKVTPVGGGTSSPRETKVWYTVDDGGTNHRGLTAGIVTEVSDLGVLSDPDDNVCTTTDYWANTAAGEWLLAPKETKVFGDKCENIAGLSPSAHGKLYYDAMTTASATSSDLIRGNVSYQRTWTSNDTAVLPIDVQTTYDTYGRVNRQWDGKGQVVADVDYNGYGGDPNDLLTNVLTKSNGSESWTSYVTLDPGRGLPKSLMDINGETTWLEYDGLGRLTVAKYPGRPADTESVTFSYWDRSSHPSRVTTSVLRQVSGGTEIRDETRSFTDGWGRPIETQVVAADNAEQRVVSATTYNELGLPAISMPAYANAEELGKDAIVNADPSDVDHYTKTDYDYLGRPVLVSDMSHTTVNLATDTDYYGDASRTRLTGDAADLAGDTVTRFGARQATRVIQYTGAYGAAGTTVDAQADYSWTPTGQLASITTPMGNGTEATYEYEYDLAGRRISAEDPDTGTTNYAYDKNGNLTTVDDALPVTAPGERGGVIKTAYDNLNRPISRTREKVGLDPKTLATWEYDLAETNGLGRLYTSTSESDLGALTTMVSGYDSRGRATGITYDYPAVLTGEGTGDARAAKSEAYTYNQVAQVSTTLPAFGTNLLPAATVTATYRTGGALDTITTQGRTLAEATYDGINRPVGLDSTGAGTEKSLLRSFSWDEGTGRLDTLAARAEAGTGPADYALDYEYDAIGQPLRVTATTTATSSGGANPVTEAWCYTYDRLQRLATAKTGPPGATGPTCGSFDSWTTQVTGGIYHLAYTYDHTRLKTVTNQHGAVSTYTYGTTQPHAPIKTTTTGSFSSVYLPDDGELSYDAAGYSTLSNPTVPSWTDMASTYDAQGNLTKTAPANGGSQLVATHAYDADGIRWARKTTDTNGNTKTAVYLGATEITRVTAPTNPTTTTAVRRYTTPGGKPLAIENASTGGPITWTWLNRPGFVGGLVG